MVLVFKVGGGGDWQRGARKRPAGIQTWVDEIIMGTVKGVERLLCARHRADPSPAAVLSSLEDMFSQLQAIYGICEISLQRLST